MNWIRIAAVIAFAFAASVARAEIQTLQMNPDARGGGVEPADVHLGASSRLTCQQFIALENSVREGTMSWAYGYTSAWQEIKALVAEHAGEDPIAVIAVKPAEGQKFMREVEANCRRSPDDQFVDAISRTYSQWRTRKP
jgi:hypothetical protein